MKTTIIRKSGESDLKISIKRKGRRVIIDTDAPQIARSIKRQIVESMNQDDGDMVVKGFGKD